MSDWETEILERSERETPGWPRYVRAVYPIYRELLSSDAETEGYRFVDADAAIASTEEAVFVDDFHLGDRGNRLVAEHLYGLLLDIVIARASER